MGLPDAESVSDIQRLYMILAPTARPAEEGDARAAEPKPKARLVVVAKKVLPDPARHERFFGFVAAVSDNVEDLIKGLGPSAPNLASIVALQQAHTTQRGHNNTLRPDDDSSLCRSTWPGSFAALSRSQPCSAASTTASPAWSRVALMRAFGYAVGASPECVAGRHCSALPSAIFAQHLRQCEALRTVPAPCFAAGSYETKTQGTRHQEAARVVGEGKHPPGLITTPFIGQR